MCKKVTYVLCALLCAAAAPAAAQQNFDNVEIKTTVLAPGVYMLGGGNGGNMGLAIGDDAVFIVDDHYAPVTPKIKAAIAKLTTKPVRFVLNTHWHPDHAGGNQPLGEAGAVILAHDNARRRMSTDQFIEFFQAKVPASPKGGLPVITFSDTVTFHINDDDVVAFRIEPAHTDGDVVVFWRKANVVHMGDAYVSGAYPFADLSSGGDINGIVAGMDRVLAMINADTKIIPGHGPLATMADLRASRDMIAAVVQRVKTQIAAGRTLAQIVASKPTADYDAQWGNYFIKADQFVELVYRSLTKAR